MGKQYNDEPKYELMKEFIEKNFEQGQTFKPKEFIEMFKEECSDYKDSGIRASLSRLTVNAPGRIHYHNYDTTGDILWKVSKGIYRLYDPENDKMENDGEIKKTNVNKTKTKTTRAILIKGNKNSKQNKSEQKSVSDNKQKTKQQNESSYEIAQRTREIILSINEICKLQEKKEIFDEAALFRLWVKIEKTCESKIDFKGFAENLYKLLREATRDVNPHKKNKNDPHYYLFRIPKEFLKDGTPTKHFWDIVNTLRHYFAHVNDKNNIKNIADVYKEFLGNRSGPESPEDFSKLQIKVLDLFEKSMNILLKMIRNEN